MDITIYEPCPGQPMVMRRMNGQTEYPLNGRDLAQYAMEAIEPELRQRWSLYWQECARKAAVVANGATCNELMDTITRPNGYYACPEWLAAKALWRTSDAEPQRVIEAARGSQC